MQSRSNINIKVKNTNCNQDTGSRFVDFFYHNFFISPALHQDLMAFNKLC